MKYDQVNWLEWPGSPSEQVFNDWVKARKSKKHPTLTHTSMRKYSIQAARLVADNGCSIETIFEHAAENGWRAIMYSYVIGAINREMDNQGHAPVNACKPNRLTREIPLDDELNDISWGDGL